jgi:hypothetical protein
MCVMSLSRRLSHVAKAILAYSHWYVARRVRGPRVRVPAQRAGLEVCLCQWSGRVDCTSRYPGFPGLTLRRLEAGSARCSGY